LTAQSEANVTIYKTKF